MANQAFYPTSLGYLKIGYTCNAIVSIRLVSAPEIPNTPSPLSDLAATQIAEYLNGHRSAFDLPTTPSGTYFQKQVWEELCRIPWGETRTYGQIAAALGKPGASRAVGMACNKNPLWILIPCHRVVGSGKKLTGYAGGLALKQHLLDLEQKP